jgi:nucleotide-binding universal stress UspA family protein
MLVLFEVLAVWLAIVLASGLVATYLARRWGRDPFGWLLLCAAMGPIAIIALIGTRQSDVERSQVSTRASSAQSGRPRVLIASDGSDAGLACARYAALVHGDAADVIVLTVLPHEAQPRSAEQSMRDYEERVAASTDRTIDSLQRAGISPRLVVAFGSPGEEIIRQADAEGAELIVVGRRGSGLSKAIFGSTSDYVLKNAKRPVTVVD